MQFSAEVTDSFTMVNLEGRLDTNTSPEAQSGFDGLVAEGAKAIVVDVSALAYVSSAGLRVFLATAKKIAAGGGQFRLFGLNETVQEVFDISGFSTLLSVYSSRGDAVEGL
jgi:anti-anti-sigma factor